MAILCSPFSLSNVFNSVMQVTTKACEWSQASAVSTLSSFISQRLLPHLADSQPGESAADSWLEKALVTYVKFAASQNRESCDAMLADALELFDRIHNQGHLILSSKATHAAQTLLWKASSDSKFPAASDWSRLLQHRLFDNAGQCNKARIGRRRVRAALDEGDLPGAREAFFQMPTAAQNECLSRYLAFKIALRMKDEGMAIESLKFITRDASKDPTYLYACVLDAQQSEMKPLAIAALQAILDQRPLGIHLPSLLRCTARLLMVEVEGQQQNTDAAAEEIVKVFETASNSIDEFRQSAKDQWRAEVQWWSKNAYNLAIRLCATIHPELLVRLLDACMCFLDSYPHDSGLMQQDRVNERKLLCCFLATTALIVLGRSAQNNEEFTLQCFMHAQQRISTFQSIQKKTKSTAQDKQATDRAFTMLKFNLECILHLQQWNALGQALQDCLEATPASHWDTLADLLIVLHSQLDGPTQSAHVESITQLLQHIINDTWRREKHMTRVARWLRFTFSMCMQHQRGDFSFKLLQQAASMAENGVKGRQDRYPETELLWLASTSFNAGVDRLVQGDEGGAVKWMDGALELCRWSADNGVMHGLLTEKKEAALERVKMQS